MEVAGALLNIGACVKHFTPRLAAFECNENHSEHYPNLTFVNNIQSRSKFVIAPIEGGPVIVALLPTVPHTIPSTTLSFPPVLIKLRANTTRLCMLRRDRSSISLIGGRTGLSVAECCP